ncbi:DUF2793 domain-containing protein [Aestuariibius sp. 2305UL40-4]|uniref:DUF2793 domain-containing protein n=1 Tax=Aestuariibius violaceus TaxID=3234132 RepID=UPI00345E1B7D
MTDQSPILALPYIQPSQAQKHVTHNEAVRLLDLLVQLSVTSADRTIAPAAAAEGERHVVGTGATGDWAGHDDEIAMREHGVWQFFTPQPGWRAYVEEADGMIVFGDLGWEPFGAVPEELQNVQRVGVGTSADAGNPLAVSGPATLFTHAGGGHQVKLNKSDADDTASLLFQTGWSGRAEIGTAGNDDLSVKVSADGLAWEEALRIDGGTAAVTIGTVLALTPGSVAGLPVGAAAGTLAFVTDGPAGSQPVYSDGAVWRAMDGTTV